MYLSFSLISFYPYQLDVPCPTSTCILPSVGISLSLLNLYTRLPQTKFVHGYRPKAWWLAQNKFYGLAQAKATPINVLRSKLEDALRSKDGIKIPEKILNLESEGNRKYRELSQLVLQETQAGKKGTAKVSNPTSAPVHASSKSKPVDPKPKAATSSSKGKGTVKPAPARKTSAKTNATSTGGASSSNAGPGSAPEPPASRTKVTARKTTGGKLPPKVAKMEQDGFEILDNYDELVRQLPGPRTVQTARKATGGLAPRKRDRSPDGGDDGPSNKRIRPDDDESMFGFLTGTYDISAPEISRQWSYARNGLNLVISLDSEKKLFASFYFGICSGVLRSTVDIEARADGASAKFEWCGREEYAGDEIYPPAPGMNGVLRFTRRKRDGRHTVKGIMEGVRAVGKCDFTGEKVNDGTPIDEKWDDFDEDSYERANKARWG
jgi:hypothetical protein